MTRLKRRVAELEPSRISFVGLRGRTRLSQGRIR